MITCPEVRPVVSQYVDSPDFRAYLKTFTDEILLACNDLLDLENLFDIDSQEGEVLDLIGSIVGQPRIWVNNGDFVWFGYDSGNLDVSIAGYGEGQYWDGVSPLNGELTRAGDDVYRKTIKARIFKNGSCGTINEMLEAIDINCLCDN